MSLDDITDDQWDALEEIAGGWVGLLRGSALRAFLALRPEQVRPWQPGDVVGPLLAAPTDDESEPAPVGEATIDWEQITDRLWAALRHEHLTHEEALASVRAVVGPLLAPAGGETVTVDEAMRISREVAEAVLTEYSETVRVRPWQDVHRWLVDNGLIPSPPEGSDQDG